MKPCRLTFNWLRYEVAKDGMVRHVNDVGEYVDCPSENLAAGEPVNESLAAEIRADVKRRRHNKNRRARDQAMRDIGMVRVRGNLGGTYWE